MNDLSGLDPVEVLAQEFAERYRRGERPSLAEYADRHPELAEQIRELFPALVMMEELGSVGGAGPGRVERGAGLLEEAPTHLGDYRILREVGRGGMGVVYEAVQESLGRHVALKVLPRQAQLSAQHLERFRREARAAARLHHTNIVPVFGVGEHDGFHYFAMQFIQGQGLDEVLKEVQRLRRLKNASSTAAAVRETHCPADRAKAEAGVHGDCNPSIAKGLLSGRFEPARTRPYKGAKEGIASHDEGDVGPDSAPAPSGASGASGVGLSAKKAGELPVQSEGQYYRSVAQIGVQVAEALEYAHQQGVLHRDIKPSNLLLDGRGTVWVSDFGLAKTEGAEDLTQAGDILGTMRYMAPERFHGQSDKRGDVYGLGVTLYEMLTLSPAFPVSDRGRLVERVVHEEPPHPRQLDPHIPRDLETVVLKAIRPEPDRRYPSAGALAEDLRRFLKGEPIQARRIGLWERGVKWAKRRPAAAALWVVSALAVAAFLVGSLIHNALLETALSDANTNLTKAREANAARRLELAKSLFNEARARRLSRQMGHRTEAQRLLRQSAAIYRELGLFDERAREFRSEYLATLVLTDVREALSRPRVPPWDVGQAVFDPKIERYFCPDLRGNIRICRVSDDAELLRLPGLDLPVTWVNFRFSPSGRFLVAAYDVAHRIHTAVVWDLEQPQEGPRQPLLRFPGAGLPGGGIGAFGFHPDERQLVVRQNHATVLYDWPAAKETRRFTGWGGGHLCVLPDGETVALVGGRDVPLHSLETGAVRATLRHRGDAGNNVAGFDGHSDLKLLAISTDQAEIHLWNPANPARELRVLRGHDAGGVTVHFSPTGRLLSSSSWDGTSRLWDPLRGSELLSVRTRTGFARLSADDRLLATRSGAFERLRTWEVIRSDHCRTLFDPVASGAGGLLATPCDGRLVARITRDGLRLWDAQATLPAHQLLAHDASFDRGSVSIAEDGNALLAAVPQGLQRWPIERNHVTGEWTVGPPHSVGMPAWLPVRLVAFGTFRADANAAILYPQGGPAVVVRLDKPQYVALEGGADPECTVLSPDGRWVAAGGHWPAPVRILDARSGRQVRELLDKQATVAFSPDSQLLVTGTREEFTCRRVSDWQPVWRFPREDDVAGPAAFAPDGSLLALTLSRTVIAFVDPQTGQEIATLPSQGKALGFSRDGRYFLSAGKVLDAIQVWDLPLIRRDLRTEGLDWEPPGALSPVEAPHEALRLRIVK